MREGEREGGEERNGRRGGRRGRRDGGRRTLSAERACAASPSSGASYGVRHSRTGSSVPASYAREIYREMLYALRL
jgi:hypothetical protein